MTDCYRALTCLARLASSGINPWLTAWPWMVDLPELRRKFFQFLTLTPACKRA